MILESLYDFVTQYIRYSYITFFPYITTLNLALILNYRLEYINTNTHTNTPAHTHTSSPYEPGLSQLDFDALSGINLSHTHTNTH